jgi:hypothetical protein
VDLFPRTTTSVLVLSCGQRPRGHPPHRALRMCKTAQSCTSHRRHGGHQNAHLETAPPIHALPLGGLVEAPVPLQPISRRARTAGHRRFGRSRAARRPPRRSATLRRSRPTARTGRAAAHEDRLAERGEANGERRPAVGRSRVSAGGAPAPAPRATRCGRPSGEWPPCGCSPRSARTRSAGAPSWGCAG